MNTLALFLWNKARYFGDMNTRIFALPLLLFACDGGESPANTPVDAARDALVSDVGGPDACPTCPDARVIGVVDFGVPPTVDMGPPPVLRPVDEGCSDIYAQEILPVYNIEIDDAEWAAIQDEFAHPGEREAAGLPVKPYHPIRAFRYNDEIVTDAMIRLKANPNFSWVPPKMQFVISFREVDKAKRFHGQRKINLDAPWYDRSLIRERVATSFLREAGLPAPCANNAVLLVNGVMYGLYVNKEHTDKEFLERNFEDAEGNLYKYGYELKTNESQNPDLSRRDQLQAAADLATLDSLIVRRQMLAGWAGEAMLPHRDGFWCCQHNYYIYDEPGRGFQHILHDMDITFDTIPVVGSDPGIDPVSAGGPEHFRLAMADSEWRGQYMEEIARMLPLFDPDELSRRVDFYAQQTAQAYAADPNLPFEKSERPAALRSMKDFFRPRRDYLASFVDLRESCDDGETVGEDRDRDGHGNCTDCDDLNRQVFPNAPDACNERDDDCDGRTDEDQVCNDCMPFEAGGLRYALCAAPQAWFDGHRTCSRQGGTYGIPQDPVALQGLAEFALSLEFERWWIGTNDGSEEGVFVDLVGRPLADLPWGEGQPNGDDDQNCVALDAMQGGQWIDDECLTPLPVICQLP